MATDSPDLPSWQYDRSNTTARSPSPMANDEDFIRIARKARKSPTPERNTKRHGNFFQRLILSLPIFHPFGAFKRCWDLIITMMLMYTAVEIPVTFVGNLTVWTYVNFVSLAALIIDGFLFVDIFISFRTLIFNNKYDHLRLEVNPFAIAKRYFLSPTFLIDVATSFPYQLVMNFNELKVPFAILRSLKLIRLYRMMKNSTSNRSMTSTHKEFRAFVKIFKLACYLLLIIHYTACIWWGEGEAKKPSWMDTENARELDAFEKYSYSLYFVVTIKFVKATNVTEQWITIIHTLIGTATLSYFIGTLSSMISKGDIVRTEKEKRMSEAQAFCDQYNIPIRWTRAILAHLKYHCANNYIFDKNKIFDNIPTYLYRIVAKHLPHRFVQKITFFKPLRSDVRGLIALNTNAISCNAGHKLFKKGDKYNKIYIQRTGRSVLSFHDGSGQQMKKRRGDVFGEDALCAYLSDDFNGQNRSISTLQCKTWCEFYVIEITDVIEILKSEFGKKWKKKLKEITKLIVVKNNIFNNRYTPRYKVTDVDLATTNKAKIQTSFKSLFQFIPNEFDSIIHPQLGDIQTSANASDLSPLESNTEILPMDSLQIETGKSRSKIIQLTDIKRNSTYRSISMSDIDENKSDESTDEQDDDIDIVIEESKETKEPVIDDVKNGIDELDENDCEYESDGLGNNLYSVSKQFAKQYNGKKQLKKRTYVSEIIQLENGSNEKQLKNGKENEDQIDRATTMSVIDTKPIKKNNLNWKPRSNSFSIGNRSDEYRGKASGKAMKQSRNRTHSFNIRTSYFKKTKSELRDRHLSFDDGISIHNLAIPQIPENNTIYKIDEDMD